MSTRIVEPTKVCSNPACPKAGQRQPWSAFDVRERWEDGTTRRPTSRCKVCRRADERDRGRRRYRQNPEDQRERLRHYREYLRSDKTAWGDYLERQRMYNATYRRRRGQAVRNLRSFDAGEDPRLPVGPFREWLLREIERVDSLSVLADRLDVDESTIRKWIEVGTTVALSMVDRAGVRSGVPDLLNDLYPFNDSRFLRGAAA
jgi:hypothetical protein